MKSKGMMLAMVACAALLGCASVPPDGRTRAAKDSQNRCYDASAPCVVSVFFVSDCPAFHRCLGVDPEFILVNREKVKITWELSGADTNDFAFDPKPNVGIKFEAGPEHFDCKTEGDGKKVKCDDKQKNDKPTVYKYTINVIKVKGFPGTVDPLDPFVVNH